jgi:uncharacterized coiled-coil protein SlyX
MTMINEPPENLDWRAFGPLLKDAQERLGRVEASLKKQDETIKVGFQLLHEDIFSSRSESRMVSNRLSVVETSLRELEGVVRETEGSVKSMDAKLDLIVKHLGLDET